MPAVRTRLFYFDQAIRHGSIRSAAEALHVASSAINRQLLQLEAEMGLPLFERLPRGIRPTAAGEVLLGYIRRWNREEISLRQELSALRGGIRGTIRVAAAESLTEEILPLVFGELNARFPLVDTSLVSGDNHRLISELFAKEADVVIAFDFSDDARAEVVHVVQSPLGVICKPDHPIARLKTANIGDCSPYPFIVPGQEWLQHSGLNSLLHGANASMSVVARVERPGMLKALVRSGLGIAVLTHLGVEREIAENKLSWVPLARGIIKPASVAVMVPRGRVLPLYTAAFVDILKRKLSAFTADNGPEFASRLIQPPAGMGQ